MYIIFRMYDDIIIFKHKLTSKVFNKRVYKILAEAEPPSSLVVKQGLQAAKWAKENRTVQNIMSKCAIYRCGDGSRVSKSGQPESRINIYKENYTQI